MKKYIKKLLVWAMNDNIGSDPMPNTVRKSNGINSLNISVGKAVGGSIVTVSYYDEVKGQHREQCYIVSETDDFSEALTHIITVENLTR